MNYLTKSGIRRQKVLSQWYVNLPPPLAAAIGIEPDEIVAWKSIIARSSGSSADRIQIVCHLCSV